MKTISLPQKNSRGSENRSSVIMHHYLAQTNSIKERSVLTMNAISLVIRGHKTMYFSEKTVHANENEIHMLTAGNCIATIDISSQGPFESVLIFFSREELADFCVTYASVINTLKKNLRIQSSPYVSFKKDDFIINYINSLLLSFKKHGTLSESMKQLKLRELLLYLLEHHTRNFLNFKTTESITQVEMTIRSVMESNALNNLTLHELSFLCNLSLSTFKRHFQKIYGIFPNAWLLRRKMDKAVHMLTVEKTKPSEIWFQLGFETHTGFTKAFKKHFGYSPKDYFSSK